MLLHSSLCAGAVRVVDLKMGGGGVAVRVQHVCLILRLGNQLEDLLSSIHSLQRFRDLDEAEGIDSLDCTE